MCTCYMGNLSTLGYGSSFKMIWKLAVLRMVCRSLTSGQVSLTHPSPLYPHISPLELTFLFLGHGAPAPLNVWRDKLDISLCSSIFFLFFLTEEQPFSKWDFFFNYNNILTLGYSLIFEFVNLKVYSGLIYYHSDSKCI